MARIMNVYCPDCRGRFVADFDDIEEKDLIECDLCMAEMEIIQMSPFRVKLFVEE